MPTTSTDYSPPKLILYRYPTSPWSDKISNYLALRKLPYLVCNQPPILPRPDISQLLGITYRRIPLLAVGNTVLVDTELIIPELKRRYPAGALGTSNAAEEWAAWTKTLFPSAAGCIPGKYLNETFRKDREDLLGRSIVMDREKCLQGLEKGYRKLEEVLSQGSGQTWLEAGTAPSMAEINVVWLIEWTLSLPGMFSGSTISAKKYPAVYAWVKRFRALIGKEHERNKVSGAEAKEIILSSPPNCAGNADLGGPWKKGEVVEIVPADTPPNHPQRGTVMMSDATRVVLEVRPEGGNGRTVRVMFPLKGYKIARLQVDAKL